MPTTWKRARRATTLLAGAALFVAPLVSPAAPAGAAETGSWLRSFSGWDRTSSPTLADVNGDGVPDAAFGHQNGFVDVVDGRSGHDLAGWPQATGAAVDSTPAVADVTGDGRPAACSCSAATARSIAAGCRRLRRAARNGPRCSHRRPSVT
jgi:hypothetical protein